MKAVIYNEYGSPDVLRLADVEKPTPKDNEVLVRIRAVNVNYGDLLARKLGTISMREFTMPSIFWPIAKLSFGLRTPKQPILGNEFTGDIEAVGAAVTQFNVGDAVIAYRGEHMGAYAEYACVAESGVIIRKPASLSYEEAATLPYGALTALGVLKKARVEAGQKVLVNGASGSIGAGVVQLAKHMGAHVTGVCGTAKQGMVKALGADRVLDYTRDDFTTMGEQYDVIIDVLGRQTFGRCKKVLTANGRLVLASFKLRQVLQNMWTARFSRKKLVCALVTSYDAKDLAPIMEMVEAGIYTTVIDRTFPLAQTAEAHRYAETGRNTGRVIITV